MSFLPFRATSAFFLCFFLSSLFSGHLCAQAPASEPPAGQAAGATGGLTGLVTDPSGAVVAEASVSLTDASGASYDTTTNKGGIYEFKDLALGAYALKAVAKGFDPFTQENMQITANQVQQVNVSLTVHVEPEKVEVTGKAANQATQAVPAKGPTGGLTGMVTDPSGAGVPKASVRLTDARGAW